MKRHLKRMISCIIFAGICMVGTMETNGHVYAAEKTVLINEDDTQYVELYVGDTGKIVPNPLQSSNTGYDSEDQEDNYFADSLEQELPVRYTYEFEEGYWEDDDHCMTIDVDGNFTATKAGTETIEVTGYSSSGMASFYAEVCFTIRIDMSNVKLANSSVKGYLVAQYDYGNDVYYNPVNLEVPVISSVILDEDEIDFTCKSSNKNVSAYASLQDNLLKLELFAEKKCSTKLTITIGEKTFNLSVSLQPVRISSTSCLLEKGQSKKLKIQGYSGKVTWSSTDSKLVSVSKSGVIKGKKIGNAVITARFGEQRVGCAVSVTTSTLKKVCVRATYIGRNWTYSQAKRSQNGYYDCSALVWKAYREYTKVNFGSTSYPGTTKTESAWCRDHKKLMKGGYSYKKVLKMQMNPGDIVFKSTDSKNPYTTTYHVEMFTGYICTGYDSSGRPIVESLWAARGVGYGAEEGSLMARPMK